MSISRTKSPGSLEALTARRLVVVTGLSGAGKSQAVRALEDLGYFCVDNLPIILMATFAELILRAESLITKAALVVDVREGTLLEQFPQTYAHLQELPNLNPVLIFLDADDDVLVRRFSESRRPHPLAPTRSVLEGVHEERRRLTPIRAMADMVINTTALTVHQLRQRFKEMTWGPTEKQELIVTVLSFGFKYGIPVDADLVFDVRFLPNPHFVPGLREQTGRDRAVREYLDRVPATGEFLERTTALLAFLLPQYVSEGKSYLTIGIGCTGGRHRSVAMAEALRRRLTGVKGVRVRVRHRDMVNQ